MTDYPSLHMMTGGADAAAGSAQRPGCGSEGAPARATACIVTNTVRKG
ncbi:hypothetical protein [Aurantiacibacter xanthus]|nr:hypothetical protein [Aurantiacibacter xanthus]